MSILPIKLFGDGFGFLHKISEGLFVEIVCIYKPDGYGQNTYFNCNVYHNGYSVIIEDIKQ
jgi:hypothetical protein